MISTTSTGLMTININFNNLEVVVTDYIPNVKIYIVKWIESFDFTKVEGLQGLKDNIDRYFANPQ